MGFFKKMKHVFSSKKYILNETDQINDLRDFVALNVGAINAEQTGCFCNSLETGIGIKDLKKNLSSSYEIVDHTTAISELTNLKVKGQRFYYDLYKKAMVEGAEGIPIEDLSKEEFARVIYTGQCLVNTEEFLVRRQLIGSKADYVKKSVLAWDLGRLVFVARCCYDCEYITASEAWTFIREAYAECSEVYNSWEELAAGYIIGRASQFGDNMMLLGLANMARDLQVDANSPWLKYPFK